MRPWRRRPRDPGLSPEEPISQENLAWRIGATDERPTAARPNAAPPGGPVPAGEVRVSTVPVKRRARPVVRGKTSRLILWTDASAILFGIIAVALVAQLALSNRDRETVAQASGSTSGLPSNVALGATSTLGGAELPTIGPAVDPSLIPGIEATPTLVPPPTRAPATTRPIVRPVAVAPPRPTPRPTAPPATAAPTATPAPTPTASPIFFPPSPPPPPSPVPAPVPVFTCVPLPGTWDIACTNASLHADTYLWDFGDGNFSSLMEPTHTYSSAQTYTVKLTVTNATGSDLRTQDVTVSGP